MYHFSLSGIARKGSTVKDTADYLLRAQAVGWNGSVSIHPSGKKKHKHVPVPELTLAERIAA